MAENRDFYALAARNGVEVLTMRMPESGSMSAEVNGRGYIGLDSSCAMTAGEEQAHLGHELGHCLYGGFYTRGAPYDVAERHEVRADKWYIRQAIPRETLFGLLRRGYDAWEIADRLNTTEEYVRRAYYYYRENP